MFFAILLALEVSDILILFIFDNFKSYNSETCLDLTATAISEHKSNIKSTNEHEAYNKFLSIWGSNASGKSNVLNAFSFMKQLILSSLICTNEGTLSALNRFQYSKKSRNGKSMFEVRFISDNNEYQYGFICNNKVIYEEWLYKRNNNFKSKFDIIFVRVNGKFKVSDDLKKFEQLYLNFNQKGLIITLLDKINFLDATIVLKWFTETEIIFSSDKIFDTYLSRKFHDFEFDKVKDNKLLWKFLKEANFGIEGITTQNGSSVVNNSNVLNNEITDIYTLHRNLDTKSLEEYPLLNESKGTIKILTLYFLLNDALRNGRTVFIDEFDNNMHPLIISYFVKLFISDISNTKGAQLIITAQDLTIMSKDILRRDQIWFAQKDNSGESSLFPLISIRKDEKVEKIRKDASYSKDYLNGKYTTIPDISSTTK